MSTNPTLQIPRDVIEPIIQAHIQTAVIQAIGDQKDILNQCVVAILNSKVDSSGQPERYSGAGAMTWLKWAVDEAVKKAAKSAIEEALKLHADKLKEQIVKQLKDTKSPLAKQLAEGMVNAMATPSVLNYRLSVSVEEKRS